MAKEIKSKRIESIGSIIMLAGFLLSFTYNSNKETKASRPNIIVILADDAGYSDFGFMGSKDVLTPHLDKLAGDGVFFKQHYVSASVCSPSRAGLLTGRYQQRFGHECNLEPEQPLAFDTAQVTMAEALKQQGYRTAIVGKWHLGDYKHQHPLNNGFDEFWGFIAGGRSYFFSETNDKPGDLRAILHNHEPDTFSGYLTDVLGDKAVQYIDQWKRQPFFLYLAFNAPHTPIEARPDVLEQFKGKTERPVYAAMIYSMDAAIGKVISKLKEDGLYDNTLIFFLSDNGAAHNNGASPAPWKGWKGNEFEGGIRSPLIVSWPHFLKHHTPYEGMASSLDIFATALRAAGAPANAYATDGKDLLPFLQSNDHTQPVHDALYWRKDQMAAARMDHYKLVKLKDGQGVLYDLAKDPAEKNDLSKALPSQFQLLLDTFSLWENNMKMPIWKEPGSWNTVTRMIYEDLMNNRPVRVKEPADLHKK
jgi:arylsulfatase A-like enzyme